jgi:hypothetical protein
LNPAALCLTPPGAPICGAAAAEAGAAAAAAAAAAAGLAILCAEKIKDAVDDVVDCAGQWADAIAYCRQALESNDPPRGVTGGYSDVMSCARGLVSAECGGNPI